MKMFTVMIVSENYIGYDFLTDSCSAVRREQPIMTNTKIKIEQPPKGTKTTEVYGQ